MAISVEGMTHTRKGRVRMRRACAQACAPNMCACSAYTYTAFRRVRHPLYAGGYVASETDIFIRSIRTPAETLTTANSVE